jgi:hypothetical protein
MVMMFPIPQKYIIEHPFLTPEHYSVLPDFPQKVKCLLLPFDGQPVVINENYDQIVSELFSSESSLNLFFSNNYHMVLSESIQFLNGYDNYIATHLFRMYSFIHNQEKIHLTIKGNALLFGTYRHHSHSYVLGNYSVPYEMVEQSYRLYETGIKTNQIKVR